MAEVDNSHLAQSGLTELLGILLQSWFSWKVLTHLSSILSGFLIFFLNEPCNHTWKEKETDLFINYLMQCRRTIGKMPRRSEGDQHQYQCSAWIQEGFWTSLGLWKSLLQCSSQMNLCRGKTALLKDTEKNYPNRVKLSWTERYWVSGFWSDSQGELYCRLL